MPQVQTSISVDSELLRAVDKLAAKQNRNRSNMIAVLIGEALAARGRDESEPTKVKGAAA